MNPSFDTEWSDQARLTFERLPADVQADFIKHLRQLVAKYADLYQRRPVESQVVGTVSHMHVPEWTMWLRLDTDYTEDDTTPVLFINELEELSAKEFEQSLTTARTMPGRMNPPT